MCALQVLCHRLTLAYPLCVSLPQHTRHFAQNNSNNLTASTRSPESGTLPCKFLGDIAYWTVPPSKQADGSSSSSSTAAVAAAAATSLALSQASPGGGGGKKKVRKLQAQQQQMAAASAQGLGLLQAGYLEPRLMGHLEFTDEVEYMVSEAVRECGGGRGDRGRRAGSSCGQGKSGGGGGEEQAGCPAATAAGQAAECTLLWSCVHGVHPRSPIVSQLLCLLLLVPPLLNQPHHRTCSSG